MSVKVYVRCKNVFKGKNSKMIEEGINNMFIELINQRNKKRKNIFAKNKDDLQIVTNNV